MWYQRCFLGPLIQCLDAGIAQCSPPEHVRFFGKVLTYQHVGILCAISNENRAALVGRCSVPPQSLAPPDVLDGKGIPGLQEEYREVLMLFVYRMSAQIHFLDQLA